MGRLESGQSSGDGERNLGSCGRIGIKEANAFKGELKCDFAKAPAAVVEGEKAKLEKYQATLDALSAALAKLG